MPSRSSVTPTHLGLLQRFGKSRMQRGLTSAKKAELWRLTCETGGVAHVPYEDVVDQWRRTVTGDSTQTSLAVGGTVDPEYVTIAVCYQGKSIGGHTSRVKVVLARMLRLYAKCFDDNQAFMDTVYKMAKKASSPKTRKKK